jgi:PAS domain S-box-containing protein
VRPAARASLQWRLPLLIAAVIVVAVATILGGAYTEVRSSFLDAGGTRARGNANELASLLAQQVVQRATEVRRVADHPALRDFLQGDRGDTTSERALDRLASLTPPRGANQLPQTVELWSSDQPVLSLSAPPDRPVARPSAPAPVPGYHLIKGPGSDAVVSESVEEIRQQSSEVAKANNASARLGLLVVRRPIGTQTTADALMRLVGNGASIRIGDRSTDAWTNFMHAVSAPVDDPTKTGIQEIRDRDGKPRLGALADIPGTVLSIWVDFPESALLAPVRAFVIRMSLIGVLVVIGASVLGRGLIGRITTPLRELTEASEAIAAGQYSRRVATARGDEIGRLGEAFNSMTEQVERAHGELEERVKQRTASLEEASELLEQHVRELSESRKELDQFFSLSVDMLCIIDMETGRFKRANSAWEKTLGWPLDELTSRPFIEFVHPEDVEATLATSAAQATGATTSSFENRYQCRDGSYRWLSWHATTVSSRKLVFATARDVTEQRRTAQALERHAKELTAVNQELEAFSYSVSHDLRAPLRHITGFAALLSDSTSSSLDADGQRFLKTIVDAAARMGRLIDDLLAFSRVGRTPLGRSRTSLNQVVREAQHEVMASANGHAINWHLGDLPAVHADPSMLRLVFVNLLSNAVKYSSTRNPSEIVVGTMPGQAPEIVVFVRDNGVGFDMAYADKLFGVFQRLHRTDEFEGTGIGLANVRRIVQRHGGRAWAEATLDGGATFYISLPRGENS